MRLVITEKKTKRRKCIQSAIPLTQKDHNVKLASSVLCPEKTGQVPVSLTSFTRARSPANCHWGKNTWGTPAVD